VSPQNSVMQVVNLCTTVSAGGGNTLQIFKAPGKSTIAVSGTLPVGEKFEGYVAVSNPAELFLELLKQRLQLKGITVTGISRVMPPDQKSPAAQIEIARLESPPLSAIAARTMKVSQNLYAETLLWTVGEEAGRKASMSGDSQAMGTAVVRNFLNAAGVLPNSVLQYDGSGLSRHDLVTPSAIVALYRYMANQSKYSQAWINSLSIGGVDGTLGKRYMGSTAAGSLRGKTGTLDQVSALSGYLTTAGGDQIVISIIVNGVADSGSRKALIDDVVLNLANFNGKIDQ